MSKKKGKRHGALHRALKPFIGDSRVLVGLLGALGAGVALRGLGQQWEPGQDGQPEEDTDAVPQAEPANAYKEPKAPKERKVPKGAKGPKPFAAEQVWRHPGDGS